MRLSKVANGAATASRIIVADASLLRNHPFFCNLLVEMGLNLLSGHNEGATDMGREHTVRLIEWSKLAHEASTPFLASVAIRL